MASPGQVQRDGEALNEGINGGVRDLVSRSIDGDGERYRVNVGPCGKRQETASNDA